MYKKENNFKFKSLCSAVVLLFLFFIPTGSVAASLTPQDVIEEDVIAQNDHNWSQFLNIRTANEIIPEDKNTWISLRELNPNADFLQNIISAKLVGLKPIPLSLAAGLTHIDRYLELYSEIKAYYVAIAYEFKEETRRLYNGVNYRLYILAPEEGRWVIIEASEVPVYRMIEAGYAFGTPEEITTLKLQTERIYTGKFTNAKGELIEDIRHAAIKAFAAGDHQEPSTIWVYRVQYGSIDTVDFTYYVKNVLPKEWYASWPNASLRAGALAAKMYGWYLVYFAKYPGQGFDVKDSTSDQVYVPGSQDSRTDAAVDYVNEVGVDRADGQLFLLQYYDGRGVVSVTERYIRDNAGTSTNIMGSAYSGDNVCILSNIETHIDGFYWAYLIKTLCDYLTSNYSSYTKGWMAIKSDASTTEIVGSYWTGQDIFDFKNRMTQWGTKYWADQGGDYSSIIHYFYDYSSATGGQQARLFTVTGDTTLPTVTITSPTSASTYTATSGTLNIGGTASDNVGVTQVSWSNDRGGNGTASGTTSWSVSGITLQSGTNVITVTARDAAGNTGTDTLTVTYGDTTPPTVTITSPTSASTYTATSGTLNIGGTASDNVGVTQVTWSNDRGGSGTASGTTSWSVSSITLQSGSNLITVTARDAAGNTGTDTLTVTYGDTIPPTVTITSPTSASTYTATSGTLNIGGTASDNVGVTQVTWSNDRGGSGTASGTTSWSVSSITLQSGTNLITVTARDAAGNTGTDTLTVTYETPLANVTLGPDQDVAQSSQFTVPVHVILPSGKVLGAYKFRLTFDTTALQFVSIQGGGTTEFSSTPNHSSTLCAAGDCVFNAFQSQSLTSPTGDVHVAGIKFNATGMPGSTTTINLQVQELTDASTLQAIPSNSSDSLGIHVAAWACGDVNRSCGLPNMTDALIIAQCDALVRSNCEATFDMPLGDINSSGGTTVTDALIIAQVQALIREPLACMQPGVNDANCSASKVGLHGKSVPMTTALAHGATGTDAIVSVDAPSQAETGLSFNAAINVALPSGAVLGAYKFLLSFDTTQFQLNSLSGGTTTEFSSAPNFNSGLCAQGSCTFNAFQSQSLTSPTGLVNVANFSFTLIGNSGGTLDITVVELTDASTLAQIPSVDHDASITPPLPCCTLTVTKSGTGTVTGSGITCGTDCNENYTSGTLVTLTATPVTGWTFSGWSGCDNSSGVTCNVTMNSNKTVTATFTPTLTGTVIVAWQKTFGGSGNDTGFSVTQTSDGGYIVGGCKGDGCPTAYIVKTDPLGNLEWDKEYSIGSTYNVIYSIIQTTDGGYAVTGFTNSPYDVFLMKIDSAGNRLWAKIFGGSGWDDGRSMDQTSDGGYIIAGSWNSDADIYLIKTDSSGTLQWEKTIDGGLGDKDYAYSVQQTTDGGYIIAGAIRVSSANDDVLLMKTDASGNVTWTKRFGGSLVDSAYAVQQTADSGYIVAGRTEIASGNYDVYLAKTDSAGNLVWEKTFASGDGYASAYAMTQTFDGGYILAGPSESSNGSNNWDAFIIKTDSAGNLEWEKILGGAGDRDYANSVQQADDGGYIIAGSTNTYGAAGSQDLWLIKLIPPRVWQIETVDSAGNVGPHTSIALDSSGRAHISYYDQSNGTLKYANNTSGSWVAQTVDNAGNMGEFSSIGLDASDRAHISYHDITNGNLKYATNASGIWFTETIETVDNAGDVGEFTSIALDSSGGVHISYLDYTNGNLNYVTNASGAWVVSNLDTEGYVGHWTSIALDSSDRVHISYLDNTNQENDLKYATNASGAWAIETVDGADDVGHYTSIAIDTSGRAHISYLDRTNRDLKYATNAPGSWVIETVDSAGDVGYWSSIALDASGRAHISYHDETNGNLKYATNASGAWAIETVDSAGSVGSHTSIGLDASDRVHISYYDETNGDLKYATNAQESAGGCLEGDIDNSGMVDISDIIKGLRFASGADTAPTTETELCRSDLDQSGQVNILDAIKIMRKALGLD